MKTMLQLLAAAAAAATLGTAVAGDGPIQIDGAWSRAMPPVARNGAAYLVIHNNGTRADRVVGGESTVAERVEVHTHVMQGGLMKMTRLEAVELPAGGTQRFEPGGLHVMLMELKEPLEVGKTFSITLRFAEAPPMSFDVMVKDGAMMSGRGGAHGKHGSN